VFAQARGGDVGGDNCRFVKPDNGDVGRDSWVYVKPDVGEVGVVKFRAL